MIFSPVQVLAGEFKTQDITHFYQVGKSLEKNVTFNKQENLYYENGEATNGAFVIDGVDYFFANGIPQAFSYENGTFRFFTSSGVSEDFAQRLTEAYERFMGDYASGQSSGALFETSDIEDAFLLVNMIRTALSNPFYAASQDNIVTVDYKEMEDGTTIYSVSLNPEQLSEFKQALSATQSFYEEYQRAVSGADDDFAKCRAINSFMVRYFDYNQRKADSVLASRHNESESIADLIQQRNIICIDYAQIFQQLCLLSGISTDLVLGTDKDGVGHMWDVSYINGSEYYTDVTWNDTSGANRYLLISKEQMELDHVETG